MHISQELTFLDHLSVSRDITFLHFFIWNFLFFGQNEPIKIQILGIVTAPMKINLIPYAIFQTTNQFSFKYCFTLQCRDK